MSGDGDDGVFKVPAFKAPAAAAPLPSPPDPPKKEVEPEKEPLAAPERKPTTQSPAEVLKNRSAAPLEYREPEGWLEPTGETLPPSNDPYFVEEIKNGTIVATHKLVSKTFFVVGRLPANDIKLEHPSLSRHHAVLQYKSQGSEAEPVGFYLYDLGSVHGTYHNKHRCFPKRYYR